MLWLKLTEPFSDLLFNNSVLNILSFFKWEQFQINDPFFLKLKTTLMILQCSHNTVTAKNIHQLNSNHTQKFIFNWNQREYFEEILHLSSQ